MKEYRKLISFGKNSFVISLPKSWITQNKLIKGDLIHVEDDGHNLLLSRKDLKKEIKDKTKVINIDGRDLDTVQREINSSYILNFRSIILKGDSVRDNIRELQSYFHNLIALEVMEQTPNSLIAKDFLNMDKVSVEEIIRKMDIVTRTMLNEACEDFTEKTYKNVNDRDIDVNRLYYLLYRASLYNLDNPLKGLKNFKLSSIDLVNYLFTGYYIEGIADEVRRTARYSCKLKLSENGKNDLMKILNLIKDNYLETMKIFYARDSEKALKLAAKKLELNIKIDEFEKKNHGTEYLSSTIGRMRRLISFTHSVGRMVYQGYNYFLPPDDLVN
jgi:phosphate uptake regulator